MYQGDEYTLKQHIHDLHEACKQYRLEQQLMSKRKRKMGSILKELFNKVVSKHEKITQRKNRKQPTI